MELLIEYLLNKLLNRTYTIIEDRIKKASFAFKSTKIDIENALKGHANFVVNWSSRISFRELQKPKNILDIFILLDFYLQKRRSSIDKNDTSDINIKNVFNSVNNHIVLLGNPGAGKTTSMMYLCQQIVFDETFYPNQFNFPVVIRLRDLNEKFNQANVGINKHESEFFLQSPIFKILYDSLNIDIEYEPNNPKNDNLISFKRKIMIDFLGGIYALLILDGFDEIVDYSKREIILEEIDFLTLNLPSSARLIVTSRTGEFPYDFENTDTFEIAPLNKYQIEEFAGKWLDNSIKSNKFIEQIKKSPYYDAAIRPLTIAHLCAIFEQEGSIPSKPKTVYKFIVQLYIKEWDIQRRVYRTSKYAGFETDRKFDFLSSLAFNLTVKYQQTVFSKDILKDIYSQICLSFDLPKNEVDCVVDELEAHHGLILKSGFEKYEFAHKSIQEYLTAEHIVRLPYFISDFEILEKIPHELALATSISSDPTSFFQILTFDHLSKEKHLDTEFIEPFLRRLFLEKPDFISNQLLGIGILTLVSKILRKDRYTVYEKHLNLLDELYKLNNINESLSFLKEIYKFFERINIKSDKGNEVHLIKLKKKTEKDMDDSLKKAPTFLFVPINITEKLNIEN